MIDDKISRQMAIDIVKEVCARLLDECKTHVEDGDEAFSSTREVDAILKCNKYIKKALREMEYHYGEHCSNCKEYDKERHSCPRFNDVIASTIRELEQSAFPLDSFLSLDDYDITPESVEDEGGTVKWGIRIRRKEYV